jgi:hypothetical protein
MPASSHNLDSIRVRFDHDNAVADAGLLLPATLADKLGLERLADEMVTVGYRSGRKLLTLVHTLIAGGDCIDDTDLLRGGGSAAWLALQCSKSAVTHLLRIAWRTVGSIITRVGAEIDASVDRLEGLRRIGIDEISYKRGHRYLTVVVDHDSGALVWAAPGRDKATLRRFFDALGEHRSGQITHVSADGADWIATVVAERCRPRCCAPIRSTWSPGARTRSMRSDAKPGTRPVVRSTAAPPDARPGRRSC